MSRKFVLKVSVPILLVFGVFFFLGVPDAMAWELIWSGGVPTCDTCGWKYSEATKAAHKQSHEKRGGTTTPSKSDSSIFGPAGGIIDMLIEQEKEQQQEREERSRQYRQQQAEQEEKKQQEQNAQQSATLEQERQQLEKVYHTEGETAGATFKRNDLYMHERGWTENWKYGGELWVYNSNSYPVDVTAWATMYDNNSKPREYSPEHGKN